MQFQKSVLATLVFTFHKTFLSNKFMDCLDMKGLSAAEEKCFTLELEKNQPMAKKLSLDNPC